MSMEGKYSILASVEQEQKEEKRLELLRKIQGDLSDEAIKWSFEDLSAIDAILHKNSR